MDRRETQIEHVAFGSRNRPASGRFDTFRS